MGKKEKKHSKGRLDKYYYNAKNLGFRSRASFKLIEINKKYNFLKDAKILIDLCAAPGSWLQVASKEMSSNSIILGFDLDPIKNIPNCKTYQCDITTNECLDIIKSQVHHMKADVVLNDGAPNVGGAWNKDAFAQNDLVLSSFKIACLYLKKNGTFLTKVFRSVDTNSLIWVFKQFFKKVNFVKPPASRNTSAEIFLICEDYLNPNVIDPKFFDPNFVFKNNESDLQHILLNKEIDSINKIFKKRNQRNIEFDTMVRYKTLKFEEFLNIDNPFAVFVNFNKIVLSKEDFEKYSEIVPPQKSVFDELEDLKLLNKGEVANILKWRSKLKYKLNLGKKVKEEVIEEEIIEEIVEDKKAVEHKQENEDIFEKEIAKMERKKEKQNKKELDKKLMNFIKNKEGLINVEEQIDELNNFNFVNSGNLMNKATYVDLDNNNLKEKNKRPSYNTKKNSNDNIEYLYELKKQKENEIITKKITKDKKPNNKEKKEQLSQLKFNEKKELIKKEKNKEIEVKDLKRGSKWFDKEIFDIIDDNKVKNKIEKNIIEDSDNEDNKKDGDFESESDEDYLYNNIDVKKEIQKKNKKKGDKSKNKKSNKIEIVKNDKMLEENDEELEMSDIDEDDMAENLAIAKKMLRKHDRDEILDNACYKYTEHVDFEENLPDWFLEDEKKHRGKILPVTKEEVEEEKKRWKLLEATPSKKVMEAKQRKKKKLITSLNKVKSKAEEIIDDDNLNAKTKMSNINRIYKKAINKSKDPRKRLIVTKKFGSSAPRKKTGRKFKVVDRRTKKDLRNGKFNKNKKSNKYKRK